jgi:hypothetical protein
MLSGRFARGCHHHQAAAPAAASRASNSSQRFPPLGNAPVLFANNEAKRMILSIQLQRQYFTCRS